MKKGLKNFLFSLEKRGMRGNLIEMLKITKGFDAINAEDYLTFDRSNITRRRYTFKNTSKRFSSNGLLMFGALCLQMSSTVKQSLRSEIDLTNI